MFLSRDLDGILLMNNNFIIHIKKVGNLKSININNRYQKKSQDILKIVPRLGVNNINMK